MSDVALAVLALVFFFTPFAPFLYVLYLVAGDAVTAIDLFFVCAAVIWTVAGMLAVRRMR